MSRRGKALTVAVGCAALLAVGIAQGALSTVPVNVNASLEAGNQAEQTIAVDPTNTSKVVVVANEATVNSLSRDYSTNGGATWTRGTVATNVACCDPQMAFDSFGNLFLVYINEVVSQINVIVSTDGGATFSAPTTVGTGSIDQPSIAVGAGSVWVDWNVSGSMVARGAPVTGLGAFGPFGAQQSIPSATGSFGDIAVGPSGQVTVTYQSPTCGQGPATIFANTDADGLGAGGFGARVTVSTTNVGGFDFIPALSGRSVDAEAGLAYDRTGGAHNGRLYLVYTDETVNESNNMNIYVRISDDSGATWGAPLQVNDDVTVNSQFLPHITLDQSTANIAVTWHDARNDLGVPGSGSTNATPNDDAMYYGAISRNFGASWGANFQISAGVSNAVAANNGTDYGDYTWSDFAGGHLHPAWADNSNSTGNNPDGTLHHFDVYSADIAVPTGVQLVTFTAVRVGRTKTVRVKWRTGSEPDLVGFRLSRVVGKKKTRIGGVFQSKGATGASYSYKDVLPKTVKLACYTLDGLSETGTAAALGKTCMKK
jgi:hypothetical protein